jgi:hypothetical protein
MVGVPLERDNRRESRGRVDEFVVSSEVKKATKVRFFYRAPDVTTFVMDDVILMGVVVVGFLGARWRSVGVKYDRVEGRGRTILLVIKTVLFLCRQRRNRRLGRRGAWKVRAHTGRRGNGRGNRCRGSDLVDRGRNAKGIRRRAFLARRAGGETQVRAVGEGWARGRWKGARLGKRGQRS